MKSLYYHNEIEHSASSWFSYYIWDLLRLLIYFVLTYRAEVAIKITKIHQVVGPLCKSNWSNGITSAFTKCFQVLSSAVERLETCRLLIKSFFLYVLLDDLPNLLIESKELLNVAFPSSNVFICDWSIYERRKLSSYFIDLVDQMVSVIKCPSTIFSDIGHYL